MKKIIVTTCLLATGFLLTACGESQSSNESQQTTIQFMHSSVEQERLSVINELVADFEKENPDIKIKQVPVEESAFNTKIVTLARSGKLPEVMEVSQDFAKVMDKDELIDQTAVQNVIEEAGEDNYYDGGDGRWREKLCVFLRCPYRKPTQVGRKKILRPTGEGLLRNSASSKAGGSSRPC